ncbi:hypothetical protein [Streptomyces flavofungini]
MPAPVAREDLVSRIPGLRPSAVGSDGWSSAPGVEEKRGQLMDVAQEQRE